MKWLTERIISMTKYLKAKIKDRDKFRKVFPLPRDSPDAPEVAKFILSIIGRTIPVRKLRSNTGSFYYVSDRDSRFVIMPSWIEYVDTMELVPVEVHVHEDGVVVVSG